MLEDDQLRNQYPILLLYISTVSRPGGEDRNFI
jgi:hypothetical protein